MAIIHQTAIVHPKAKLASTVEIGPYCTIGENVELLDGVKLISHVCIDGVTTIGDNTKIFPFAAIGLDPQDLKYKGEKSRLVIGQNVKIREYVTIHPGTSGDKMETRIGDNCLLMVGSHVAHDCIVGNNVILANNATLAGHVEVGDFAIIGGLSAVHQFVRIGQHAIIGGMSGIDQDIIPYGSATGDRANLSGLNLVGLKRRNFDRETIHNLREAYRILFLDDQETFDKRIEEVETKFQSNQYILEVLAFLKQDTSRAVCFPKGRKK
jgi:UDP-N-acetylglucosamine acyltransferase